MPEIAMWKVQAAFRLLGLDPDMMQRVDVHPLSGDITVINRDGDVEKLWIVAEVPDKRLHVLGIDPENGKAELDPVADGDVAFFTGAGMYLDGLTKHANGTLMPVFKKADPE
jgi:hypothetical protein